MREIELNGPLLSELLLPLPFMYVPFVGHLLQPPLLDFHEFPPQTAEPRERLALNCDVNT